jgi:cytochrome c oxidase subunit 2
LRAAGETRRVASRFRRVFTCVALLALVLAGAAAAGNGGLAPPAPASPGAANIRSIYWLLLGVAAGIFLLVEVSLVVFLVRYRSRGRGREVEGAQIHGHTKLELAWTAVPVLILAAIVGFVFSKIGNINGTAGAAAAKGDPPRTIRIEGHQYYWEFRYPDGKVAIRRLKLPINQDVKLEIVSADVNHSWWVPALGGKLDAIPGRTNTTTWRPTRLGSYTGQCAEFCGLEHAAMQAVVDVVPDAKFQSWLKARTSQDVGRETYEGVCATCHGMQGQGIVGPAIAGNPLLADRKALTILFRQGRLAMPAVGSDWSTEQLNATISYLRKRFKVQGGTSGG